MTYHQLLLKKSKSYAKWHKSRACQPAHWLVLLTISFTIILSLFANLINLVMAK